MNKWNDIRMLIILVLMVTALTIAVFYQPVYPAPAEQATSTRSAVLAEWLFDQLTLPDEQRSKYCEHIDIRSAGYSPWVAFKFEVKHEPWPEDNYTVHWVSIWPMPVEPYYYLCFSTMDRSELVTPGYQKILTFAYDYNLDDTPDTSGRDYYVITEEGSILAPDYPEGFVNKEWYTPPVEFHQAELNLWWGIYNKEKDL